MVWLSRDMRKRICHVITGLPREGAQRVLVDLLRHRNREQFEVDVVSLKPRDAVASEIERLDVPLYCADLRPGPELPLQLGKLSEHLLRVAPDVLHTWLYHADVLSGAISKLRAPRVPVVWHLHHAATDLGRLKLSTRALIHIGAALSHRLPERILCCGESTLEAHARLGYDRRRMQVIRNGVDVDAFRPRSPEAPRSLVAELGLEEPVKLVGLLARLHPVKDHATFLAAALPIVERRPEVHVVLCGSGVTKEATPLREVADHPRVHILGDRSDMPTLLPQLDVIVSSSTAEATSVVLMEAMAAGVPAVATRVGDSASIIGSSGELVPPRDPLLLEQAVERVLGWSESRREKAREEARARALGEMGLEAMARAVEEVYRDVIESQSSSSSSSSSSSASSSSSSSSSPSQSSSSHRSSS